MDKITTVERYKQQITSSKPTVLVFKTTWCKDCHYIEPFMPDVEAKYADRLEFYEIDRDELPDLCLELGILGIPSFIVFKEGREVVRFVSKLRKTQDEIEQFLNRAIEVSGSLPSVAAGNE